ncbi:hypothetical protein B9N43_01355 [Denitratisoma sp. DHT3]|uniref:TetR/AcrR family transcriptional regulator n=1 Tax=Denitratisoma sp. DHT3 TaxID=1981880 RepID=UPI001198346C|nr:TetR/AcrR family transcriptional regulator [Denitratisoma sp. DHT3]QDX80016.1 hypothetical protein B9N43_01355 [Denitratisoma sp. DHT3]
MDTRTRLLHAAEHLFAREGIERTQTQAIIQLAEQRNSSALHYHFGSREGLIRAIFERHLEEIEKIRAQRLSDLKRGGKTRDLRSLVEALVLPIASKLATPDGRNYLLIVQQYVTQHGEWIDSMLLPPSLKSLHGWLCAALRKIPKAVAEERIRFAINGMMTALASRVRAADLGHEVALSDQEFVDNLIGMIHGALGHPWPTYGRPRKPKP